MERTIWQALAVLGIGMAVGWLAGGTGGRGAGADEGGSVETIAAETPLAGRWDMSRVPPRARKMAEALRTAPDGKERMRIAIELANSVPVDEIEEWLDGHYADTTNGWIDTVCERILTARLYEADRERCLARCFRVDHKRVGELMARWTREDQPAAEAFMHAQADARWGGTVATSFLMELAKTSPRKAIELMADQATGGRGVHQFTDALEALAAADRDALRELSAAWPPLWREQAMRRVTEDWLRNDLAGAVAWLADEPDGQARFVEACRDESIGPAVLRDAASLPEGWLEAAAKRGGHLLVRENPEAWLRAEAAAIGISEEVLAKVQELAADWIEYLPGGRESAMAVLAERPDLPEPVRAGLVNSIVGRWAEEDREATQRWIEGLADEDLQVEAWESFPPADQRSNFDRVGPDDVIASLFLDRGEQNTVMARSEFFTADEMAEARAAFRALPAEQREQGARALLENQYLGAVGLAPQLRAEAVTHRIATAAEGDGLIRQVSEAASDWGGLDPHGAAEWVESLPEGEPRTWAARNLVLAWSWRSETEAREWAEQLSDQDEREAVLQVLSDQWREASSE